MPDAEVLCVDVGGTRIKLGVLPLEASRKDVLGARVVVLPSLGWLNDSLPRLLSTENVSTLLRREHVEPEYGEIRVSVPGPVTEGRFFERPDLWARGVPRDLEREFEVHCAPLAVSLVKDADAWTAGAIRCAQLLEMPLEFPSIALTLGTGVGICVAASPSELLSLEIAASPPGVWDRLTTAAGRSIRESWEVHQLLGHEFFAWVAAEKGRWSVERIRHEFTKRVSAFVLDAREGLAECLSGGPEAFKSLVVGGGNAGYLSVGDLERETGHGVQLLARPEFTGFPEVLPLLGLTHYRDHVAITEGRW